MRKLLVAQVRQSPVRPSLILRLPPSAIRPSLVLRLPPSAIRPSLVLRLPPSAIRPSLVLHLPPSAIRPSLVLRHPAPHCAFLPLNVSYCALLRLIGASRFLHRSSCAARAPPTGPFARAQYGAAEDARSAAVGAKSAIKRSKAQ